jgi:hypothetical protein
MHILRRQRQHGTGLGAGQRAVTRVHDASAVGDDSGPPTAGPAPPTPPGRRLRSRPASQARPATSPTPRNTPAAAAHPGSGRPATSNPAAPRGTTSSRARRVTSGSTIPVAVTSSARRSSGVRGVAVACRR